MSGVCCCGGAKDRGCDDCPTAPSDDPLPVFKALGDMLMNGAPGIEWTALVSAEDWAEHKRRLESVIDAQAFAESQTDPQRRSRPNPEAGPDA